MKGYLVILAVAAGVTLLTTPLVRWISLRAGLVSMPGDRHLHERPTPTLGGAAMFLGFLAAMAVASRMDQFNEMFHGSSEPLGIILGAGAMFVVGLVDDVREVSPPAKLAGQVLAGGLLSLFGVSMFYFRVPFLSSDFVVLAPDLAPLITVLWVILMANALNLIDGLDGLAAGITIIAGAALFLYADRLFKAGLLEGSNVAPLIAIIAVGVCAGFLPYNFNPARIFMGDAGALFLGLLLATTTITIGGRTADQFSGQTYFFFAPLLIPILILGVPILDVVFSVIRRLLRRQSISVADTGHLHHRLMRLGHGPRRSVVILWAWTAILSAVVLWPTYTNRGNALVPLAVAALALLLYVFFHPGRREAREGLAAALDADQREVTPPAGEPTAAPEVEGTASVVDIESRRKASGR